MNDEKLEQPLSEENTSAPEMPETVPEEVLPENELHPDTEQTEETIPDSTEEIPAIEPVLAGADVFIFRFASATIQLSIIPCVVPAIPPAFILYDDDLMLKVGEAMQSDVIPALFDTIPIIPPIF